MSFDLSTILIILVVVVPGLFAQRTRSQITPRSFAPQGASAELAELVALGIATHAILVSLASLLAVVIGMRFHGSADFYFALLDRLIAEHEWRQHLTEAGLALFAYIFLAYYVSYWLGFLYGILGSSRYIRTNLFSRVGWLLRLFGISDILGESPIIYELLNPEIIKGTPNSVFVEIELRDEQGFYSGQVSQYAIVKDEEPHKPIVLIDVWFKLTREETYKEITETGVSLMLDLADALTVSVRQIEA